MNHSLDDILAARAARAEAWRLACSGAIDTAELYRRVLLLRAQFGEDLYTRPTARHQQRELFR